METIDKSAKRVYRKSNKGGGSFGNQNLPRSQRDLRVDARRLRAGEPAARDGPRRWLRSQGLEARRPDGQGNREPAWEARLGRLLPWLAGARPQDHGPR